MYPTPIIVEGDGLPQLSKSSKQLRPTPGLLSPIMKSFENVHSGICSESFDVNHKSFESFPITMTSSWSPCIRTLSSVRTATAPPSYLRWEEDVSPSPPESPCARSKEFAESDVGVKQAESDSIKKDLTQNLHFPRLARQPNQTYDSTPSSPSPLVLVKQTTSGQRTARAATTNCIFFPRLATRLVTRPPSTPTHVVPCLQHVNSVPTHLSLDPDGQPVTLDLATSSPRCSCGRTVRNQIRKKQLSTATRTCSVDRSPVDSLPEENKDKSNWTIHRHKPVLLDYYKSEPSRITATTPVISPVREKKIHYSSIHIQLINSGASGSMKLRGRSSSSHMLASKPP